MKAEIIESKRLIIKPLGLDFLSEKYVNWMNDSDVNKYLSSGGDYTIEKLKNFLIKTEDKNILFWAIIIKESKNHIGNIKIDPVDFKNGIAEYGIMMGDKNEWGKGYAKEVSKLVINYCFESLNLRKITLGVIENNKSAVELYKKLNFEIEGKYIDHVNHNGKFLNVLRMSLFKRNYRNL